MIYLLVYCTCSSSLTSFMGTNAILEMVVATLPARNSLVKDTAAPVMLKGKRRLATVGLG